MDAAILKPDSGCATIIPVFAAIVLGKFDVNTRLAVALPNVCGNDIRNRLN
jgi:hypothetical protein